MRTAKVNVMAKLAAHRGRICDSTPKVAQTHHQSATMKQAAQPALTFTAPALNALHCPVHGPLLAMTHQRHGSFKIFAAHTLTHNAAIVQQCGRLSVSVWGHEGDETFG